MLLETHSIGYVPFQIAVNFARKGHKVWYVTANKLTSLPLDKDDVDYPLITKDILRIIYFKYMETPKELVDDILQLHMYRGTQPTIVIIDYLHTFFTATAYDDAEFMQKHMLIAASLHSSIDSLAKCLNWKCFSILCVDTEANDIYGRFIQIFVDSYFGRARDIYTSSKDLLDLFLAELA